MTTVDYRPQEYRIRWHRDSEPAEVTVEGVRFTAVLCCRIRARYGADHPIAIVRRRQGETGEWEPWTWDQIVSRMSGKDASRLKQLPGWLPRTPIVVPLKVRAKRKALAMVGMGRR